MVRDYLYVGDLVQTLPPMLESEPKHQTYNLGSGIGVTINEVIDTMRKVTGEKVLIEERPKPSTFVNSVVLEIHHFQSEYGPILRTHLVDGIRHTWNEIRGQQDY